MLAVSSYLMFGATLLYLCLRMSRFIIKFCRDLADQPGSVVVYCGIRGMPGSRDSGFDTRWLLANFFVSLI